MKPYAIGIDLGGTTVKIGLFTTAGELLYKWEIVTRTEDDGEHILPDIADSILSVMSEKQITAAEVEGAGIGVPGAVLANGIVNRCVNVGWGIVNVASELSKYLGGIPVKVGNDANVAALGEMWKGGGMGYRNLVMVTLGTGIGGGIIINEEILTGAFGAAGEIGHIPVNYEETETCGCGKKGCLEQYASASRFASRAVKKLSEIDDETILRNYDPLTTKDILDAAKEGDKIALELLEDFGLTLGRALAAVSAVADPEAFVIGGGMSKAGPILLDAIRKNYIDWAFHASKNTDFVLATLGNDAGMYGAVRMLL